MNNTNGKIALQSRKKITKALFSIMEQYNFKDITVTQIAQESNLSRKTFYRLYNCKEDILNEFFTEIYNECLQEIKKQQISSYWSVVQLYFDFWEQRYDLILLLKKHDLLPLLMDYSLKNSPAIFATVRSDEIVQKFAPLLPYMLSYAVGGMHSMLITWIENDRKISSTTLIQELKAGLQSPYI